MAGASEGRGIAMFTKSGSVTLLRPDMAVGFRPVFSSVTG